MKFLSLFALTAVFAFGQEAAGGPVRPAVVRSSPTLNILDVNQDGMVSAAELAAAPTQLIKLDKNGDGKLNLEEAGMQRNVAGRGQGDRPPEEPPSPAPSADELTITLMSYDANHNGKLEKKEVPARMQGIFERGDTDHNGVLTREEIAVLAEANRQTKIEVRRPGGLAFNALDVDHDGEISADEIAHAVASLSTLDKNGDGQITEDDLVPNGPGRGASAPGRGQ